jgi:hypothetical protein
MRREGEEGGGRRWSILWGSLVRHHSGRRHSYLESGGGGQGGGAVVGFDGGGWVATRVTYTDDALGWGSAYVSKNSHTLHTVVNFHISASATY